MMTKKTTAATVAVVLAVAVFAIAFAMSSSSDTIISESRVITPELVVDNITPKTDNVHIENLTIDSIPSGIVAMCINAGVESDRPVGVNVGDIYWATDTVVLWIYDGLVWCDAMQGEQDEENA